MTHCIATGRSIRPTIAVILSAVALSQLAAVACHRSSRHAQNRPISCHYFPNWEPAACELASDGSIVVPGQSLAHISFGPEGLGSIAVDDRGLYFVNRKGKTAPALPFDNGTDYVVEGLARILKGGKVGFVNAELDQVVAPVWDFALPFERGLAVVCMGCVSRPPSPGDEHRIMAGGKWGYIDKRGRVVVPIVYDSRSLPSLEAAEKALH